MKNASITEVKNNLSALIDGVVRPSHGVLPKTVLASKPPRARRGSCAVGFLLDGRREGR